MSTTPTYPKMDPKVKTRWVKALRSGKYRQGSRTLREDTQTGPRYCCLGVLLEVTGQPIKKNHAEFPTKAQLKCARLDGKAAERLADWNDGRAPFWHLPKKRKTFKGLATWIEKHLAVVLAVGLTLTAAPVQAATIDLTDKVVYNVGAPSLTIEGVTFTAEPSGYLQFTGYGLGVCSSAGWSCNEAEFPEALRVDFAAPVTLTAMRFGYLQSQVPAGDRPGYIPHQELAVVIPSSGAPLFFGGSSFDGLLSTPVNIPNVLGFRFFGIGQSPGVWGTELHAASLAGFSYERAGVPPPPTPVPEPLTVGLFGFGLAGVVARLKRRS